MKSVGLQFAVQADSDIACFYFSPFNLVQRTGHLQKRNELFAVRILR
jgi:hypothetical protein